MQKKARRRMDPERPGRHRDASRKQQPSGESPSYRCSKCKLFLREEALPRLDEHPPKPEEVQGEPAFLLCPGTGPERGFFVDPENPHRARARLCIDLPGRKVRACSPYVTHRVRVTHDGIGRAYYKGPLLSPPWLLIHAAVELVLREAGAREELQLDNLPWLAGVTFSRRQQLRRAADGRWSLSPPHNELNDWALRVLESPRLSRDEIRSLLKIVVQLDPDSTGTVANEAERNRSTIYVPIDMRLGLEDQWREVASTLRELQKLLLRLCGRGGAWRPAHELDWRDVFIYGLRRFRGLTARQIADEVFPGERGSAARVRKILSRVRGAAVERV